MKKENVVFKWKKDNRCFKKELKREELLKTFEGLIKGHPDNCEISKRIVKVLPTVDEFFINWDMEKDVNGLFYKTGKQVEEIQIIHHHKIVWGILNNWRNGEKEEIKMTQF